MEFARLKDASATKNITVYHVRTNMKIKKAAVTLKTVWIGPMTSAYPVNKDLKIKAEYVDKKRV